MVRKSLQNQNLLGQNSILIIFFIVLLFCSCSNKTGIGDENNKLLKFSVSVPLWKGEGNASKTESRATPITDSSFGSDKSFNLIADQKEGTGSYSTLINNEIVTCSNSLWKIAKDYYWSGTDSKTINFYAYYPASIFSNITHTSGSAPTLDYTVPDNAADQIDILAAASPDVSGSTGTAIPLTFKHIFAAVKFSMGTSGMPGGTITKVTLNNIQYKGTCSLDGIWTPNTTDLKSFSQTVSASTNANTTITSGTTTFMMIPQTLNKDASITVTYSTGTSYTKAISGSWSAGNSYTYNLSKIPGQYLFSDGTWGSYDPNKTVIGIVFSNSTSGIDKRHGWTHGYAMALQNAGSGAATYQWYTSDSGNPTGTYIAGADSIMSDKDGYTHSGYLQTSDYAAGIVAKNYTAKDKSGNTVTNPSGTSGWYLPSIGQWYDICAGLGGMVAASGKAYTNSSTYYLQWYSGDTSGDTHNYSSLCASNLNVYLDALKDIGYSVDLFGSNNDVYYWSSSECNNSWTYSVGFYFYSDGYVHLHNSIKTNSFMVRPVIAF